MVDEILDPRRAEPAMSITEDRRMLEEWLEYHRTTLLLKVEGLDDAQRKARPVPSSTMSLHGLVRHLTEVEHWWFADVLRTQLSEPFYGTDDNEDADWFPLDDADWETDLAAWQEVCAASRAIAADHALDDLGEHPHMGPTSLRWIYVHMIEEYARHNGHADLLRELVDGRVGW